VTGAELNQWLCSKNSEVPNSYLDFSADNRCANLLITQHAGRSSVKVIRMLAAVDYSLIGQQIEGKYN